MDWFFVNFKNKQKISKFSFLIDNDSKTIFFVLFAIFFSVDPNENDQNDGENSDEDDEENEEIAGK